MKFHLAGVDLFGLQAVSFPTALLSKAWRPLVVLKGVQSPFDLVFRDNVENGLTG